MLTDPTLLVVDDEQVYCDGCERIFSRQGFRVEGSNDAAEALGLATQNEYSAILLDVKMPKMDGIRFLESLRAAKPNTPVILMTGYPSIQNAASAVRLGASDYVIKPFTPEQITSVVRGLLGPQASETSEATESEDADSGEVLFHGRAWIRVDEHGAARVGGVVPRPEDIGVELQLPRVGDVMHQGLPLFAVWDADGNSTVVPSPVTGTVLELNSILQDTPDLLWAHPCGLGWVAKVAPTRLGEEVDALRQRSVLAVTDNSEFAGFYQGKLSTIGCNVDRVAPEHATTAAEAGMVLMDAASCGKEGPDMVDRLLAERPDAKVVVVAPAGSPHQDAYRAHRLFYYAVPVLEDREILDIVDSCYHKPSPPLPRIPAPSSWNLPLSAIHVNVKSGHRVTLLVPNGLLRRESGLGLALQSKLLDKLLPIETGLGNLRLTAARVLRETTTNSRVIVLMTADMSRIPGTLVVHRNGSLTDFVGVEGETITVLAIQPLPGGTDLPKLEPSSLDALANHIVDEILA